MRFLTGLSREQLSGQTRRYCGVKRANAGEVQKTPHLEFGYTARDFTAMREMGASWKVVTEATPEPKGIDRTGRTLEKK